MTVDRVAQSLHHKSVLGGVLTPEEQEHLKEWYAKMDEEEAAMFARTREPEPDLDALEKRIADVEAEIAATEKQIRMQKAANEQMRQEIESLKRLLAEKMTTQSA